VSNKDFPNAQSIFSGIQEAVSAAGGKATHSADGRYSAKPDVAIVVFGEDPYAEFVGDRATLEFSPGDKRDLRLMQRLKADGIPVVAVFLSGRPMWVNPELNASDAFVAAFLPGSEGGGVADVLFRSSSGRVRHDFKGKLSYSWPKRGDQGPLNRGDANYDPLFPYGFGLSYRDEGDLPLLSEERPQGVTASDGLIFGSGRLPAGWTLNLREDGGVAIPVDGNAGSTGSGRLKVVGVDRRAQEDARRFTWDGSGPASVSFNASQPLDISREANGELSLVIDYRVDAAPSGSVSLGLQCGPECLNSVPITGAMRGAPVGEWRTLAVPLRCLSRTNGDMSRVIAPLVISSTGSLSLSLSDARIASANIAQSRCEYP
jgi:beta-glucosidase